MRPADRKDGVFMKWKAAVLILSVICLCAGCGGEDRQKGKRAATGNAVTENREAEVSATGGALSGSAVSGGAAGAESELQSRSRAYAEQIVAGLFSPLMENLTAELLSQTTEEGLQASWNSVAGNLTGYQGVESVTETENEDYRIVIVTIRYSENQGRTIKFIYNAQGKIAGLWFDQVTLQHSGNDDEGVGGGSYKEEDITIGRAPYELAGKLVLPDGVEKPPVVILVPGADDLEMDGTIGSAGNTPMRDLARGLADYGVASLRYNKRRYQYAAKVAEDAGTYDLLLEDIWFAIDKMYNSRQVDGSRIVIAAQGKAADYLPAIVEKKARRLTGAVMLSGKPIQASENFYADKKKAVSCNARYFMDTNSTLPLLVIQGELDFETPAKHLEQWQTLLKGRSHIVYRSYRGLNHYLMPSAGKTDASDYDEEAKFSQPVIEEIGKWLTEIL